MKKSLVTIVAVLSVKLMFGYINEELRGRTNPITSRAADCSPASEKLFMEFNNIRAIVETGGFLWENRATSGAGYEFPKGSNSFVIFSGALWMGGEDVNGNLKIAAHRYRESGNDFWAGPLQDLNSGDISYDPSQPQPANLNLVRAHGAAEIESHFCDSYDRFYSIRKSEVIQFITWWNCENGISDPEDCEDVQRPNADIMRRIEEWPAHGDVSIGQDKYLAPFYDNALEGETGNGEYNPIEDGDYPWYDLEGEVSCENDRRITLFGDETHWWVFNDKGNIHTETGGEPIGIEVRAQAFAFATDDEINDMTFYNYELINRGTFTLYETYFGQYVDADIGDPTNDYVGCDVARGLGYAYNGEAFDEGHQGQTPYGNNPPAVGVDFFEGPYQDNDGRDNPIYIEDSISISEVFNNNGIPYSGLGIGYGDGIIDNERFGMQRFIFYNNSTDQNGDPQTPTDHYNYMKGIWRNGDAMEYGGDGFNTGTTGVPAKFMFPGDSDPLQWGTYPTPVFTEPWTEVSADTPPEDRRFVQAAGPFTLRPGAVNNITVGVVVAQSKESDLEASVRELKKADSKAQALFDNCFKIVEPPKAPLLQIQELENELVLYLSDPPGESLEDFKAQDKINIITPDELKDQGILYDDFYRFEGFQIYQMVDEFASVSDIGNLSKARLVAQCDLVNGIDKLINYTFNEEDGTSDSEVMVVPAGGFELDQGLRRSFRVTEDLFASGNRKLVNHKKYYFIAVSYAHNEYKKYDITSPDGLDGQKRPYLRSRLSASGGTIESVVGIPHDPSPEANGRTFTTSYGFQPEITQIEGEGNGANFLELSDETVKTILNKGSIEHPTYKVGAGPIDVKVIDPLNLKGGDYTLGFDNDSEDINTVSWWLERAYDENGLTQRDTIRGDRSIAMIREQLILDWGISVTVKQQFYEGISTDIYTEPIGATITFGDSSKAWVDLIEDTDSFYPTNWIRSGNSQEASNHLEDFPNNVNENCIPQNWIYQPCHYDDFSVDREQKYEQLLDGGIAPFRLVGKGPYGSPFGFPDENTSTPWYEPGSNDTWFGTANTAQLKSSFEFLHDVDVIITANKELWTRCPVIEINNNKAQTEHDDQILRPRRDASVDKNGLSVEEGGDPTEANLTKETGMGWFPGYAIDVNTGQRLNMVFAENSWLTGENGDDMIWNPTSNFSDNSDVPILGGMHYVYVFGAGNEDVKAPGYDEGKWLMDLFELDGISNSLRNANYFKAWRTCFWVMEPMLAQGHELLSTDVKISARIKKPYVQREVNGENKGFPLYQFSFDSPSVINDNDRLVSVLDNINIVPNPYYAYSQYETSRLDNRVKITNLPERCKVTIFNMQGALVKSFNKDDPMTSIDWDLKNHKGIPISGGTYIVHVEVEIPDDNGNNVIHEKVLKWYGALRQADLDNL